MKVEIRTAICIVNESQEKWESLKSDQVMDRRITKCIVDHGMPHEVVHDLKIVDIVPTIRETDAQSAKSERSAEQFRT
jgi:hypothetical protein